MNKFSAQTISLHDKEAPLLIIIKGVLEEEEENQIPSW